MSSIITCKTCGKDFSVFDSRMKRGVVKYCSLECRLKQEDKIICKCCNKEKDKEEFISKLSSGKIQKSKICKECKSIKLKEYRKINKDKIKNQSKSYRLKSKLKLSENDKSQLKIKIKNYYEKNKDKFKSYKEKYKNKRNINRNNKYKNDEVFKAKCLTRSIINKSIKRFYFKKSKTTQEILGCTFLDFKQYIESQFQPWMNWNNHGLYNGKSNYGWDLDHIIPISSAKTEDDVYKLNHYTNLQPLDSHINRDIKRDDTSYGCVKH